MDFEESAGTISEMFGKRRRDLLLLSVSIFIFNILSVDLKKINLLGNDIEVKNPDFVLMFLSILLIYFTLRFWQYSNEIEDKGFASTLKKYHLRLFPGHLLQAKKKGMQTGFEKYDQITDIRFRYRSQAVGLVAKIKYIDSGEFEHAEEIPISKWTKFLLDNLAVTHVIIESKLFTEFILPYLVAIAAAASFITRLQ